MFFSVLVCNKNKEIFSYVKKKHLFIFIIITVDTRTLRETKMVENLQDQAQITLAQFTQIHNPTQPTR